MKPSSYTPIPLPDFCKMSDSASLAASTEFLETMKTRHSVRHYDRRPVPRKLIEQAIATAGRAPSGANQQPWHFVAIQDKAMKARIRTAAEAEEEAFYAGGGGDEWIGALEPLGTTAHKPHLTDAPWLIVVFAQRYGLTPDNQRYKHYYVPESVGIATGILITALHQAGLASLVHTPNPMRFLNHMCARPAHEKPMMILPVGYPAENATIPQASTQKKPLDIIMSCF